jgi:Glycosyl hydrolase family 99
MDISRRSFLTTAALAGAGVMMPGTAVAFQPKRSPLDRFADLRRHFLFEYYPWYRTDPWEHWNEWNRRPPADIATNYMPALGLYDSRSRRVMEQHARWIAESGAGAIDVSWWGPDSNVNEIIPTLMDVMKDHDIRVAFYIEPYHDAHAQTYAQDVMYLIRNYGDRRRWDNFLLLDHANGQVGPVFKSFRTILLPTGTDCHGVTSAVSDYAEDDVWRGQTDSVRETLRRDFDRLVLLADSSQVVRTQAAGFDGIGLFDNYVAPDIWQLHARNCTGRNLLFSFQVNPGFDGIVRRDVEPDSCYRPAAFAPGGAVYDWSRPGDRAIAAEASRSRIVESFNTSVDLQTTPGLSNVKQGFFLVYINSFNEWHEGHQFEPVRHYADLTPAERALGYHNPDDGAYRLKTLRNLIHGVIE